MSFSADSLSGEALAATIILAEGGFVGDSIVDGPGLRCTVFVQGCPHHCPGCHNPATHPFEGGVSTTVGELVQMIKRYPLCRGVTLSGGEPFSQAAPLTLLAQLLRAEGYEVAAYSGYTFEQLHVGSEQQKALLAQLNILVDGRYISAQRNLTLRFRGSTNQRILDVPKSLSCKAAHITEQERWVG